jgi:hypothetical protein
MGGSSPAAAQTELGKLAPDGGVEDVETERAHVMDAFVLEGEDDDEDPQSDAVQSRTTAPTESQAREPPPMLGQALVPLSQESAERT